MDFIKKSKCSIIVNNNKSFGTCLPHCRYLRFATVICLRDKGLFLSEVIFLFYLCESPALNLATLSVTTSFSGILHISINR